MSKSHHLHIILLFQVVLEIPDNWLMGEEYNLPLSEMMQIIDNSVKTDIQLSGEPISVRKVSPGKTVVPSFLIKMHPNLQGLSSRSGKDDRCEKENTL